MPRRPRNELAGAIHHVWARGNDRAPIFQDDRDRRTYLKLLGAVVSRQMWRCLAFCLMSNHVHLLLETPQPNLGAGMHLLHGDYARYFNHRYARSGHVFDRRYGNEPVTSDAQLAVVAGYLAHNPVKAGMCSDPEGWIWGSHQLAVVDAGPPWLETARLFELFTAWGDDGRAQYLMAVDGYLGGSDAA